VIAVGSHQYLWKSMVAIENNGCREKSVFAIECQWLLKKVTGCYGK
jgi:hypothetical protein